MLPLALLAADKVWTEEFKEMESRRNELLKSGQIDEALKLFDEMADLEERNGEIDEASKVRRDKISLLHNAQLDSLLIAEAPHSDGLDGATRQDGLLLPHLATDGRVVLFRS